MLLACVQQVYIKCISILLLRGTKLLRSIVAAAPTPKKAARTLLDVQT